MRMISWGQRSAIFVPMYCRFGFPFSHTPQRGGLTATNDRIGWMLFNTRCSTLCLKKGKILRIGCLDYNKNKFLSILINSLLENYLAEKTYLLNFRFEWQMQQRFSSAVFVYEPRAVWLLQKANNSMY